MRAFSLNSCKLNHIKLVKNVLKSVIKILEAPPTSIRERERAGRKKKFEKVRNWLRSIASKKKEERRSVAQVLVV